MLRELKRLPYEERLKELDLGSSEKFREDLIAAFQDLKGA